MVLCGAPPMISLQVMKLVSELEETVGGGEGGGKNPKAREKLSYFKAAATALVKVGS